MKKFLFLLAAILAAISMSAANYDLYVGGVRVTDDNKNNITGSNIKAYNTSKDYKVTYNSTTQTLTLTNVRIERTGSGNRAIQNSGINGLTIVFDGVNYLSAKDQGTIKLDQNTLIKSTGGRYGQTTYIYGGSEDGLCVFKGANCSINGANLYIECTSSDAIWADTHKEGLTIKDSRVEAVSKADGGHGIYNFLSVDIEQSYVNLRTNNANFALAGDAPTGTTVTLGSNMRFRQPDQAKVSRGTNGNTYLSCPASIPYDKSVGYVLEDYVVRVSNSSDFPDAAFRQYLWDNYTWSNFSSTGYLFRDDIAKITDIDVSSRGISNLKGIEYLTNLKTLKCNDNKLTSLDLSKNTALTTLNCSNNQLTSPNLSLNSNAPLANLTCHNNQLNKLDLSAYKETLTTLECQKNELVLLDLSGFTKLNSVNCSNNQLHGLAFAIDNCPNLKQIYCHNNNLTSLDVSDCTSLNTISAYGNQIYGSDMTKFIYSLPKKSETTYLYLVNHNDENEGNRFAAAHALTAVNMGWAPSHLYNSSGWRFSMECYDYAGIWVEGKKLSTCVRPAGVSYDSETKTLTLKNADLQGKDISDNIPYGCGIYSTIEDLTIHCEGDNIVRGFDRDKVRNFGIGIEKTITIEGSATDGENATLTLTGNSGLYSYSGSLTIEGDLDIDAKGKDYGLFGTAILKVSDNATVSASSDEGTFSPIYNWRSLDLQDNHVIAEPDGASYSNGVVTGSNGSVMLGGTVKIVKAAGKLGDVNQDGEINSADVVAIYNYIIDGEASGIDKARADVDGDGEVGTADVVAVYNIIINGE